MSTVATYSYTHSVTYVTDNILKSLKDIILLSGLDPEHLSLIHIYVDPGRLP